mgnify:CR=1 FL=1
MKSITILIIASFFFFQCNKGDDYCELPNPVTNAFEFGHSSIQTHNLSDEIEVYLTYENDKGTLDEKTLFSFSTPDCFINPKGNYKTDVVHEGKYTYILKDTNTNPGPVTIEIYTFNDCGKSETYTTTIKYF